MSMKKNSKSKNRVVVAVAHSSGEISIKRGKNSGKFVFRKTAASKSVKATKRKRQELYGDIEKRTKDRLVSIYTNLDSPSRSLEEMLSYLPLIAKWCKSRSFDIAPESLLLGLISCESIPKKLGVSVPIIEDRPIITEHKNLRATFVRGGSPGSGKRS